MHQYNLVSADGHVNEPPTIWSDRLPARYRARGPKMVALDEGDAWVFEGWDGAINFGYNAAAGLPVEAVSPWVRWSDVPKRTYDPAERLKALDQSRVDAELLYATPRIAGGLLASASDPDFHIACIRAYNDWLSELCSYAPDRLMGLALMPAVGADAAVDELHRAMELPGIRAPYIGRWPSGEGSLSAADDLFWSAVEELDAAVSVHVSVATGDQRGDFGANRTKLGARGEFRGLGGPTAVNCLELISTGVFDRFPDMRIVFAECESGWVPCARQTFDDRFRRYPAGVRGRPKVKELPGFYFDRNIFTTFVIDPYAIRNRDLVGVEQMMWSNDLFHAVNEWPHDWAAIEPDFAGVPADEKELILAGNAVRAYRLGSLTPAVGRP